MQETVKKAVTIYYDEQGREISREKYEQLQSGSPPKKGALEEKKEA